MSKHSPTPWSYSRHHFADARGHIIMPNAPAGIGCTIGLVGACSTTQAQLDVDGEHIVRCVNSHDELLAALKECVTEDGSYAFGNGVDGMIRRLRAINETARDAIAKAKNITKTA